MRRNLWVLLVVLPLLQGSSFGQRKDCEDLKKEIAAKLDAKGVKNYTLTITATGDVKEKETVVGSCDAGSKKIVYTRG
jgi:hypothetical protein